MKLDYQVTFEYMLDAPQVIKGVVEATEVQTCARRALEEAKEKVPGTQWSSIVILLARQGVLDKPVRG
jgi:hypothetical protein